MTQEASQGGRRLMLRVTTQCNSGCAHCTIADIAHHPDKPYDAVVAEIGRGFRNGCDELVFMRGEATLDPKGLIKLTRVASKMGYHHIQLQTNARMLSYAVLVERLVEAGMTFFEVSFFGHDARLHDAIDGTEGAFKQASAGLRNLVAQGCPLMVTVPVVKLNYTRLEDIVDTLHEYGVSRVQFNFSRPVKLGPSWNTEVLVRLSDASPFIRRAIAKARRRGMIAETEAVPLCHLDPEDSGGADVHEDFGRHQVADVHRQEDSLSKHREAQRPISAVCEPCSAVTSCPRTWAAYQRLYGTWEFRPLRGQRG